MGLPKPEQVEAILDQVLGYLNFSSGNHDPKFFANLNVAFGSLDERDVTDDFEAVVPNYKRLRLLMSQRLDKLAESNPTFRDCRQARKVLEVTFENVLPGYRKFHRDLLFHQSDALLFNSFFVARVFETILQFDLQQESAANLSRMTIERINDFIGHRPVATLESRQIEPYEHEWIRPIPLFVREAGVAVGPYAEITEQAIRIIGETDPHILRAAHFDLERLFELAIDPRAFDFDHPINQRPNHHFGQWDGHLVDNSGYFHRFVIHQVTLDSLLERVNSVEGENDTDPRRRDEAMLEASAVLAGTMLMASGISGSGPGTYDSNTTLAHLLPVIAGYRDQFYDDLMKRIPEKHRDRLKEEAKSKHQPFGAVRQDLNSRLAQRRASQLVNCRLAAIFARMGYPDAAEDQSKVVPVAAARINCQIDCLLSTASDFIRSGEVDEAFQTIPKIMSRLKRGNPLRCDCRSMEHPWI